LLPGVPGGSRLLTQPRQNALRGVVVAQGVVDPAVPELLLVLLLVDASGVDAQEDSDAVSGAAGDLGAGTPALSWSVTPLCRRS
jgi:hypothetical protein